MPRDDLFITSKLRNGSHVRDKALKAFDDTMQKLGLDVIDMFLIHWPVPGQDKYVEAWKTLVELQDAGAHPLDRGLELQRRPSRADHRRDRGEAGGQPDRAPSRTISSATSATITSTQDIPIESYSPLGSGEVLDDKTIAAIAKKHGKSPAQVMIRWHLDEGLIVIPKSTHAERIRENIEVFDFELDDEDRAKIAGLDKPKDGKVGSDPASNNDLF